MARHCCCPIKQYHLDNISRLKMGDFGWDCKLMETWLSRKMKSLCGLQIATKLTVKRCIARKCANLYTSSSAIAAFYMIRLENAYGLLKALIALINRFGTTHAGLFRMMVIYDQRTGNPCWARFGFVPGRMAKRVFNVINILPDGAPFTLWEF